MLFRSKERERVLSDRVSSLERKVVVRAEPRSEKGKDTRTGAEDELPPLPPVDETHTRRGFVPGQRIILQTIDREGTRRPKEEAVLDPDVLGYEETSVNTRVYSDMMTELLRQYKRDHVPRGQSIDPEIPQKVMRLFIQAERENARDLPSFIILNDNMGSLLPADLLERVFNEYKRRFK